MKFATLALLIVCSSSWGASPKLTAEEEACRESAGFNSAGTWIREPAPEAIQVCELAAESGHPDVLGFLGRSYYFSDDIANSQRTKQAREAIQASQRKGSLVGTALMGIVYEQGYDVAKDDAEAAFWFRKAARLGSVNAQYNLGVFHAEGLAMKRDAQQAAAWYRKAAEKGYSPAQFNLGEMYEGSADFLTDWSKAAH